MEEFKQIGNELYKQQKYSEAVEQYSKGLEASKDDPILLSNRSVAYWKLGDYKNALEDAKRCVQVKPDWVKGYLRKTVALNCLKNYQEARDTAITGFCFNDLKLTKEFVSEWLKANRAQVDSNISELLLSKPYYYFYPDGVDLINSNYCETLMKIIVSLMPSQSQGVLGISHDDMVKCLCNVVQILEDILAEFKQDGCQSLIEWKDKVIIDVDAFNAQSQTELLGLLNEKCSALACWLLDDLHKALVPVVAPVILLAVIAVLSRSFCLRCRNTSSFALEYLAQSCLPFFDNCILTQPIYISTRIEVLFLILFSYGSVEMWTKDILHLVQSTQAKIQGLISDMPKSTKNYDLHMEEYTENLSVFLDMNITQTSDSQFSHNPTGIANDLEHILLVECVENPKNARTIVENQLQEILTREAEKKVIFLDVQNLFFMVSIFVKLGDTEKGLEVYQRGLALSVSIMIHLVEDNVTSLEEVATVIASLRHFALCGASFLSNSHPIVACDAFIKWKNLYSEVYSVLIRLGLRANNRTFFQLLSNPVIQQEQTNAFQFHQISEKIFTKKYFSHVLHALMAQNHDQVMTSLESTDIVLDYVFDVFHPEFDPRVQQRNDPVCYVCVVENRSSPKVFKIDVASIHKRFSDQVGKMVSFNEMEELCSSLAKAIVPPDVCEILNNKSIKRILICADSYLHDLPLEVCPWKDLENGSTIKLYQRFDIVRLSSPRELLQDSIVSSLRFIFNPSLELSHQPSILDVAQVLKATKSIKSGVLPKSVEKLIDKAIMLCGHTPDSLLAEAERLKTLSYRCEDKLQLSPTFLQGMQQVISKNKEIMKNKADEYRLQCNCKLSLPTLSLNTKCCLVGNPNFKLNDIGNVEKSMGWISSLASLFGLAKPQKPYVNVDQLPGTQQEIDAVKYILESNPQLNVEEPIVKDGATVGNLLSLESPFILHIATHGYLKSSIHTQARKSYWSDTSTALLLAGAETYLNGDYSKLSYHINVGCLTPAAVCAINLESTRLAFLSACKSGIGEKPFHETSVSILQAFRSVGTKTVISTLWSVDDNTTVDVASMFYKYLMEDPACHPSNALALTKKDLLERQEPFSVYAAFTCSGLDLPLHPATVSDAQNIEMVCGPLLNINVHVLLFVRLQTIFKLNINLVLSSRVLKDMKERNALHW